MELMYAIYDKKSEVYGKPFCAINDIVMARDLQAQLSRNPQTQLATYASDFIVVCVGQFESRTGEITTQAMREVTEVKSVVEAIEKDQTSLVKE